MIKPDLPRLCRRLGYSFKTPKLLQQALTHCSADVPNNERLEFLGDSILNFVITQALYQRFPKETEGQLSRLRAFLVRGDCLAEIAAELDLGDFLFLGPGELKSGGFRRASILADALEAVIAAVFLDGGLSASEQLVLTLFASRLDDKDILLNNIKDPKTQLQEYLQAKKLPLPKYSLVKQEGEEHEQIFHVSCTVKTIEKVTMGIDSTRRKAEQTAAKLMLGFLSSLLSKRRRAGDEGA